MKTLIFRYTKLLLVALGLVIGNVTLASGGLYIGSGISLDDFKVRYDKREDVNLFPSLSLTDLVFNQKSEKSDSPYSLNAFLGYRYKFDTRGLWLDFQIEYTLRSDGIEGRLTGIGELGDGQTIEDLLDEQWSFKTDRDRAAVIRMGHVMSVFGLFEFSPLVLGGWREIEVAFKRDFIVCGTKLVCDPGEKGNPATETRSPVFKQWVMGVGVEKSFGRSTTLQLEARLTSEAEDEWKEQLNDVDTPTRLSADSYEVSLRLAIFF